MMSRIVRWPKPATQRLIATSAVIACAASCKPSAPRSRPDAAGQRASERARPARATGPGDFLEQFAATYRFRLGQPRSIRVTPAGDAVLFLRSGPRSFGQDLVQLSFPGGGERILATASRLLGGDRETVDDAEKARRERQRIVARGITSFQLSRDGSRVLVPLSGRLFVIDRPQDRITELRGEGGYPIDPRLSPDASSVACVRDGDLYVIDTATGRQRRLTTRGRHPPAPPGFADDIDALSHGLAEFVAQEEMGRYRGFWWSPDSKTILLQQTDETDVDLMHVAEPTTPTREPKAFRYPRAGRANARVRLGLIPATGGRVTWVGWDAERHPYLAAVRWPRRGPLTVLVQNRQQTEALLLAVASDGSTRRLLVERDAAWLNIDTSVPRWLPDGASFLWSSERSGSWQLELHDRRGKLLRVVAGADVGYRALLHVDSDGTNAYIAASREPTERHLYALPLGKAGPPKALTGGKQEHTAVFGRRSAIFVDSSEGLDEAPSHRVRRLPAGEAVASLRSVAARPPFSPNLQLVTVGERRFRAAIVRPRAEALGRSAKPGARYPVLVYVYGGPSYLTVRCRPSRYLIQQWLADSGPFVVVSIDGRGTPARGRRWERALKGNFARVPLADQVAGLRAVARRVPDLDLDRVGIFGWSFGGYLAVMALLQRPDVYHAAVAGAPVTDWQHYDTHYTERYLGLPAQNQRGYRQSSALTHAAALSRPLLIVHGTADDNVYFSHSVRLSRALFLAGRPHGFLPLAGFTHMVPEPIVIRRLYERIAAFFREHLRRRVARTEAGRPAVSSPHGGGR